MHYHVRGPYLSTTASVDCSSGDLPTIESCYADNLSFFCSTELLNAARYR